LAFGSQTHLTAYKANISKLEILQGAIIELCRIYEWHRCNPTGYNSAREKNE
jgi:hypothetical protein